MHELLLDYKEKRRRPGGTDIALLAASLLIATASGAAAAVLFPRIKTLEEQKVLHQPETAVAGTSSRNNTKDPHQLGIELKQANQVAGLLNLPWNALFADIEASASDQVALLEVEPDPEKSTLTITAEAKDFNAMLSYMRRLQTRGSIKDVYLKSHEIDLKSAEVPVRFVLVASWVIQP